ncbi:MAG: helix-turn-helix domain-containing protein [Deltaproteobacteria bacterium]|nr:helix-turn-helix domain-containing protein [Deltaproteobacteria bacterium]
MQRSLKSYDVTFSAMLQRLELPPQGAAPAAATALPALEELPRSRRAGRAAPGARKEPKAQIARPPKPSLDELRRVLAESGGSMRATARHFGRARRQIYRWMAEYGLGEEQG